MIITLIVFYVWYLIKLENQSFRMAATRERRSTAGNRIAKLLDEEEEDEFYKTSYGGFSETADDRDYVYVPTDVWFLWK